MDVIDLRVGHAVDAPGDLGAARAHDDDALREARDLVHDGALRGIGLGQQRVQRRDHGHAQLAQQGEDVAARLASEDPVLVLQADDVDRADVQEVGGAAVGRHVTLVEREANAWGIGVPVPRVVHRKD